MRSRNRSRTGHFFESAEGGLGFDLQAAERETGLQLGQLRLRHGIEDLEEEEEVWLVSLERAARVELCVHELGIKAGILEAGKVSKACLLFPPVFIALPLACEQRCRKTWKVK